MREEYLIYLLAKEILSFFILMKKIFSPKMWASKKLFPLQNYSKNCTLFQYFNYFQYFQHFISLIMCLQWSWIKLSIYPQAELLIITCYSISRLCSCAEFVTPQLRQLSRILLSFYSFILLVFLYLVFYLF